MKLQRDAEGDTQPLSWPGGGAGPIATPVAVPPDRGKRRRQCPGGAGAARHRWRHCAPGETCERTPARADESDGEVHRPLVKPFSAEGW